MPSLDSRFRTLLVSLLLLTAANAFATNTPVNLTATPNSTTQITLTWTDNSTDEIGFTFVFDTNSSFSNPTYVWTGGANVTSYVHTSLSAGTTYYYRIKAEGTTDALDSPFSSAVSAATPGAVTPISTHFYGVNAWMPYQIGSHVFYGSLGNQWPNIDASGAQIMRYGGHGVDEYADPLWSNSSTSTLAQYLALVDNMKNHGIEPVLQVPVFGSTYSTTDAADIVRYVNITHARGVQYWSIGNEPDLSGGPYGYTTAAQVAAYIRPFASAMKAVDPSIKIVGPDTTWYNPAIMNGLTTPGGPDDITGKDANGRYYVDILAFHHYNGFSGSQSRTDVISSLTQPGGFQDNLSDLKTRLAACNSYHNRTGSNALRMAITEANVNYQNSANDSVAGNGAESFLGGQWWAELLGISMKHGVDFVTFWSVIEGSTQTGNELGFIGANGTTKRPTYYHFQMLAENFRGNVASSSDNQTLVKTFASKASDQIAVILLNQESSTSFNYTVRLNTAAVSGTNPLKINVDAGVAMESSGTLASQSTILLVFDSFGVLKKKIEYRLVGHANSDLPPTVTTY